MEICAGAGGQAIGLEMAGFETKCAVEIDPNACATLRHNRPAWNVLETDVRDIDGKLFRGVDLFAGGVPCPPFSIAGKQLGANDERDLFPEALRLIRECQPKAIMLENVRGFASSKFDRYRQKLIKELNNLGYEVSWQVLNASSFGVPQLRPRFVLVGLKPQYAQYFRWPRPITKVTTVGETIADLLGENGWKGLREWRKKANAVAPTIVGGSKKHGGADLGPTRAKTQWEKLGVDGKGLADAAPSSDMPINHLPRLTNRMVARIQGFPDSWAFQGKKTAQYRQIGNAFPPPVAAAVGKAIYSALNKVSAEDWGDDQQSLAFALATA